MRDTFLGRDANPSNNFGAMRLILAIFVIISHMFPAMSEEMDKQELLLRYTHRQMDLGALAVNAFFAISGYLITLSWLRKPHVAAYLTKRVLRIYPGFIAASIVSLVIVAPLAGANIREMLTPTELFKSFLRLCFLSPPRAPGTFAGEMYPEINMPLWTIRYEFFCYLLVPVILWRMRPTSRNAAIVLYLIALIAHASQGTYLIRQGGTFIPIVGWLHMWPRFLAYFFGGMAFVMNRDRIPYRTWICLICVTILLVTGLVTDGFFIATATVGIYVVFFLAYQHKIVLNWFSDKWDLSYGTYLYGWPVQMLIVRQFRDRLGQWEMLMLALPITLGLALISWSLVEVPFLRRKKQVESNVASG